MTLLAFILSKALGLLIKPKPADDFIHEQIAWATVVAKTEERPDLMAEGDVLLQDIVKGETS